MADGRHIENRFWPYLGAVLADQREIRNRNEGSHADIGHITNTVIFENSRWRTADDRHFENSIISISQPRIIRFRSNLVHRYKFPFPACKFDKKIDFFFKFKMADGRHIENRFWLSLGAILADLCKFRNGDEASHADIGHLTKMAIFANSR